MEDKKHSAPDVVSRFPKVRLYCSSPLTATRKVISDAQKEAAAQPEAAQTESQPETPASEPEAPAAAPEAGTPEEPSAPDQKEE